MVLLTSVTNLVSHLFVVLYLLSNTRKTMKNMLTISIMLAGGVGYGTQRDCLKGSPEAGNKVVVMGGDNYRIGLGGGSVSSVETGRYSSGIELNAVQRANAEMQKRAYNVVRALCEEDEIRCFYPRPRIGRTR